MKSKQVKELKEKDDKELSELVAEKRKALRDFRFGIAGTKVRDVKEGKGLRRDIARLLTEQNRRKAPNA